jgi:hypothetical protein
MVCTLQCGSRLSAFVLAYGVHAPMWITPFVLTYGVDAPMWITPFVLAYGVHQCGSS